MAGLWRLEAMRRMRMRCAGAYRAGALALTGTWILLGGLPAASQEVGSEPPGDAPPAAQAPVEAPGVEVLRGDEVTVEGFSDLGESLREVEIRIQPPGVPVHQDRHRIEDAPRTDLIPHHGREDRAREMRKHTPEDPLTPSRITTRRFEERPGDDIRVHRADDPRAERIRTHGVDAH